MATNKLSALLAIVDEQGRPLPPFILSWDALTDPLEAGSILSLVYENAEYQQAVSAGSLFAAAYAQVTADQVGEVAGATARSGFAFGYITPTGAWTTSATVNLSTVSAGDLLIFNTGPMSATSAIDESSGDFRILENGGTVVFTGQWKADGDGVTLNVIRNDSLNDTLTFSASLGTTGSVTYELQFRVANGVAPNILTYLFVRRT